MVDLYSGYPIGLKADIWALGVLLYHLCFFQLPFNTQLAIQTGEVAVPDASTFSIDIHKVIRLCLQVINLYSAFLTKSPFLNRILKYGVILQRRGQPLYS